MLLGSREYGKSIRGFAVIAGRSDLVIRILGEYSCDNSGYVFGLGDFNGDGLRDLALGQGIQGNGSDGEKWVLVIFSGRGQVGSFARGEANGDGAMDLTDAVAILVFLFLGAVDTDCPDALDADGSGAIDVTDPIYLLTHLYLGGPAPPAPFPGAGLDPTDDSLSCFRR